MEKFFTITPSSDNSPKCRTTSCGTNNGSEKNCMTEKKDESAEEEEERMQTESVFPKVSEKLEPPLETNQKQKKTQGKTFEF